MKTVEIRQRTGISVTTTCCKSGSAREWTMDSPTQSPLPATRCHPVIVGATYFAELPPNVSTKATRWQEWSETLFRSSKSACGSDRNVLLPVFCILSQNNPINLLAISFLTKIHMSLRLKWRSLAWRWLMKAARLCRIRFVNVCNFSCADRGSSSLIALNLHVATVFWSIFLS